ncbi:MAG: hypothetical protein ACE5HC_13310 [Candidatus Binatia bacterium]
MAQASRASASITDGGFALSGGMEMLTTSGLSIIIGEKGYVGEKARPFPPGEVLLEESLKQMDLSQNRMAGQGCGLC